MAKRLRENWGLALTALLLCAGLGYVAVCGQDIYIAAHDNMDSNLPWYTMLRENGLFFAQNAEVPMLGGLDRDYFPSEWNLYNLLYFFLPAFPAYIAGNVIRLGLSLAGWLALARRFLGQNAARCRSLTAVLAFAYAYVPVFPTVCFAFASVPLFLALIWEIYDAERPRRYWFAAVFFFPLLLDFSTFGIFLCGYLLLFFLLDAVRSRRPHWRLLAALAALCAGSAVMEYRLFAVMLFRDEATLRDEMVRATEPFLSVLKNAASLFLFDKEGVGTVQGYVVMPVCLVYWCVLNLGFWRGGQRRKILLDPFNLMLYGAAFAALLSALDRCAAFQTLLAAVLPPLAGFSFARAGWCAGVLPYLAFWLCLCRLALAGRRRAAALLAAAALAAVLLAPSDYNDIRRNLSYLPDRLKGETVEELTWREFYEEALFDEIKADLGYDGEWSAAFGLHPGILEQSGIATLDGYVSYYPLAYKRQFRELIAPILARSERWQAYYDNWGGRAYLFSDEAPYSSARTLIPDSAALYIDPQVFAEMGGRYIFSRLRVTNADDLGLALRGVYTGEVYTIYVYEINAEANQA